MTIAHKRVLVTGASGFVGVLLVHRLLEAGRPVRAVIRREESAQLFPVSCESVALGPLESVSQWLDISKDVDAVVHLAARVHMMKDDAQNPLAEFRRVNVEGTRHLLNQSADAGVDRFIFLSSVKAIGDGQPFPYKESDPYNTQNPYGISKMEAEQVVREIGQQRGIETVILRPTVVYGPRVRANILRLLKLVHKGVPLPLGAVRNHRSLVYVENLVSAIQASLEHPNAAGETFFVAEEPPLSTKQLVEMIAHHMGKSPRLLPIPPTALKVAGKLTGKSGEVDRLTGSLTVDTKKIQSTLDWTPPYSTQEGIKATVEWFLNEPRLNSRTPEGQS